jgi:hypothetical protein
MRTALFVIVFLLTCILNILAEHLRVEGWNQNAVGWISGIAVGITGALLVIDWLESKD